MTLRELCVKTYQETVAAMDCDPELKRALRTHERIPSFIDRLVKELTPANPSKEIAVEAVQSLTRVFIGGVTKQARENYMSDLAKFTLAEEKRKAEQLEREVEAMVNEPETETNHNGETTYRQTVKV